MSGKRSPPDLDRLMHRTGRIDPKRHPESAAGAVFNVRVSTALRRWRELDVQDLSFAIWSMARGLVHLLVEGATPRAGCAGSRQQRRTLLNVGDALGRVWACWRKTDARR